MTTRDVIAKAMSENDLLSYVVDLARLLGWRVAHFRPARTAKGWRTAMTGDPGFPDLVLVEPSDRFLADTIWVELKAERGMLTADQKLWRDALQKSGQHWYLWRPSDWMSGEVERILKGEA